MTSFASRLSIAFLIALRELRGGLKGFYIFLACIALGTGAIAAVNSVSTAITDAISSEGRTLLAGDVRFELDNREATSEERAFLDMILAEVLSPLPDDEVQVVIAGEGRWNELSQVSMVLSHYGLRGQMRGALGVIGPTSINYPRAISTVRHIAGLMSEVLTSLYNADSPPDSPAEKPALPGKK